MMILGRRIFSTRALLLAKPARPESIFTFSTRYPRGQQKPNAPSRLRLAPSGDRRPASRDANKPFTGRTRSDAPRIYSAPRQARKIDDASTQRPETAVDPRFELEGSRFVQYMAAQTTADADEITSFARAGLHQDVVKAIKAQGFQNPTRIQALAITAQLDSNQDVYIGSETGSGKTMAYLAPLMSHLVFEDQADFRNNPLNPLTFRKLNRPRAVVLVPSRHLVEQVTKIAKTMAHSAKLRVLGIQSVTTRAKVLEMLETPIDVLICTPGTYAWLSNSALKVENAKDDVKRGFGVTLSKCKHLVVDECDTLFDSKQVNEAEQVFSDLLKRRKEYHKQLTSPIANSMPATNCQFVLVSATLPVSLLKYIDRTFPSMKKITTASLHRTASTLKQSFIQVHASTTKENILIDTLKRAIINGDKRILVFTNRLTSVDRIAFKLAESQFNVFGVSSSTDRRKQAPKLNAFLEYATEDAPEILPEYKKDLVVDVSDIPFSQGLSNAMICVTTDLFSRGIDTMSCSHVVMYDFPITTIDYIHRAGRTARNGTHGQVTSIVGKRDRNLATAVEAAYQKRTALNSGRT